jgi:hypothetical protein
MVKGSLYDGGPADVWQLGVILLHMVAISHTQGWQDMRWKTKPRPFEALCAQTHAVLVSRYPKHFAPLRKILSRDLADLLDAMLDADPRNRPTTAEILSSPWLSDAGATASAIAMSSELEVRKPSLARNTHRIDLRAGEHSRAGSTGAGNAGAGTAGRGEREVARSARSPEIRNSPRAAMSRDELVEVLFGILKRGAVPGVQSEVCADRGTFHLLYCKISMNAKILVDPAPVLELHWTGGTDSSAWMRFLVELELAVREEMSRLVAVGPGSPRPKKSGKRARTA